MSVPFDIGSGIYYNKAYISLSAIIRVNFLKKYAEGHY